jgi:hypothetical protein
MPYKSEKANRLGHVPIVNNQRVLEAFSRWTVSHASSVNQEEVTRSAVPLESIDYDTSFTEPRFALTVDGSDSEVEATREYPSIKVGYLRIAAGLVDINKLRESGKGEFVDPRLLRQSYQHSAFDGAFPGSGLASAGLTGRDTWREEVNRFLLETRIDGTSPVTLAELLLIIHGELDNPPKTLPLGTCPSCAAKRADASLEVGLDESWCGECGSPIYLGDVLRTHEEYSEVGSNIGPLTRLMNVVERLTSAGYLKILSEDRLGMELLGQTIFITDGPLALFGPVAPLKRSFQGYIGRLQKVCTESGRNDLPMVVGIEKSGAMVEHANLIAKHLPTGSILPLSSEYINRVFGRATLNNYGVDEFYGRRFIYRTTSGDSLVITLPPSDARAPYGSDGLENVINYPNIRRICETLDKIRTRLYDNAVIPLALSHSAASLPLGVGESVLRFFAQQGLGLPETSDFPRQSYEQWKRFS